MTLIPPAWHSAIHKGVSKSRDISRHNLCDRLGDCSALVDWYHGPIPDPMSGASSGSSDLTVTPRDVVEGKIAIPRLPNEAPEINPYRTISACSACREKKSKCNGRRPRCLNCIRLDRVCAYTGSKRDHQKLQLVSLQRKVEVYEELLGEIISQANTNQKVSINNIIKVCHHLYGM